MTVLSLIEKKKLLEFYSWLKILPAHKIFKEIQNFKMNSYRINEHFYLDFPLVNYFVTLEVEKKSTISLQSA